MKETTRASGTIHISLPDSAGDVVDAPSDVAATRSRGSRSSTRGPNDATSTYDLDLMLDALAEQDTVVDNAVTLLDRFAVDVGDGGAGVARSRGPASSDSPDIQAMSLDVTLDAGESAVVLIEQNGSFEWHYPGSRTPLSTRSPTGSRSRGRGTDVEQAVKSTITFQIPIGATTAPPPRSRGIGTHRGIITNFIKGKILGVVLKFVARKSVGALTRRLERGVEQGPVLINSASDAQAWLHQKNLNTQPLTNLAQKSAIKLLLFVHGTFSSTIGSYAALTKSDEGQALLSNAIETYDLVLGYDHHTLSDTPEQNAEELLSTLLPLLESGATIEMDTIAFSRGGLVFRYLSEILIPDADIKINCGTAIFVGCTNAGTELADDENWKQLIDFYTNMVAGATRLIGLAPGAALPTRILRQSIKIIGSLVTYMAQDGVSDNSVPGVAAMQPGSSFVTALNQIPAHRTRPATRANYALASNFEPGGNDAAIRLGKQLVLKVSDGVVDKLMGKDNDLVVNNDSMFVIDPVPGAKLMETQQVEANGTVYHTVYFHQAFVAKMCNRWLGLETAPINDTSSSTTRNHA